MAQFISVDTQKKIVEKELTKIDMQVDEIIKREKTANSEVFYLYLGAARTLRRQHQYDTSIQYYYKAFAVQSEFNQNRMQGMLELAWLMTILKRYTELEKFTPYLRHFASQYGFSTSIKSLPLAFDYFDLVVGKKSATQQFEDGISHFEGTTFYQQVVERELKVTMEQGHFLQAHALFLDGRIKSDASFEKMLSFDLLNTILKNDQEIRCKKLAEGASGSDVDLCRLLSELKDGDHQSSKLADLWQSTLLKLKNRPELHFLIPAVMLLQ